MCCAAMASRREEVLPDTVGVTGRVTPLQLVLTAGEAPGEAGVASGAGADNPGPRLAAGRDPPSAPRGRQVQQAYSWPGQPWRPSTAAAAGPPARACWQRGRQRDSLTRPRVCGAVAGLLPAKTETAVPGH